MPKVICTLENAGELINDVRFVSHARGMISEDIEDEVAENFLSIPGYEPASSSDDELMRLRERAAVLGIAISQKWRSARLQAEIKAAEDEVAEKNSDEKPADEKTDGEDTGDKA